MTFGDDDMQKIPPCPKCSSAYAYEDGPLLICPECGHEWSVSDGGGDEQAHVYRDVGGNELADGDTVTIAKDLKVGNKTIKVGTKVQNIRLLPPEEWIGDHDIDAKVPGFGPMGLKTSVVKKVFD